jgi:hypothetical protein
MHHSFLGNPSCFQRSGANRQVSSTKVLTPLVVATVATADLRAEHRGGFPDDGFDFMDGFAPSFSRSPQLANYPSQRRICEILGSAKSPACQRYCYQTAKNLPLNERDRCHSHMNDEVRLQISLLCNPFHIMKYTCNKKAANRLK